MEPIFRDDLYVAQVDGCLILLDLAADRYFRPGPDLEPILVDQLADVAPLSVNGRRSLERAGLLSPAADAGKVLACASIATPAKDLPFVENVNRLDLMRAIGRQWLVLLRLGHLPLGHIIGKLRRRKARLVPVQGGRERLIALAAAHERSNRVISAHDRCLMKSVALIEHLLRHNLAARLVIGVQGRPFAAHCWVQADDLVLNDTVDHVRTFVPILSI